MNTVTDNKALRVIFVAALVSIGTISTAAAQLPTEPDTLPAGDSTPEGTACDLLRAFISRNESLFHARRPILSCEGKLDAANAYRGFLAHRPQPIEKPKLNEANGSHPIRLLRIVPVENSDYPQHKRGHKDLGLLLDYGAIETKLFDVITILPSRILVRSQVEAMHIGTFGDGGGGIFDLIPTNKWRARFLPKSVSKASEE